MAILVMDCPHCTATKVAFQLVWSGSLGSSASAGARWRIAATCNACELPVAGVLVTTRGGAVPQNTGGNLLDSFMISAIWPTLQPPAAPSGTPAAAAARFVEAEDSFKRGKWNSAAAMYRSALDVATKAMDAVNPKHRLYERLRQLRDDHAITESMWAWADRIRMEGNDALHELDDFTEADTKALRLFAESFFRYAFELPAEVEAGRRETPAPP